MILQKRLQSLAIIERNFLAVSSALDAFSMAILTCQSGKMNLIRSERLDIKRYKGRTH